MNYKMIFYMLGRLMMLGAALLTLPTAVSLIYSEWNVALSFGTVAAVFYILGGTVSQIFRKAERTIYAKEGFVIVSFAWLLISAAGAVPFVLSGDIPSYVDAFFETVSGFTTTGSSIVTNVEILSHGALFWRSFTHWVGGMGVLVLVMAIIPDNTGRSIHIMRAEMPGPSVDKIVPRVRDTAKILYLMYIALTAVQLLLLTLGDMTFFEALLHTLGTAGTGGFGMKADSIASYSAYSQWVITAFMLIFGVNFNLYYLLLLKKFRDALRSEELWTYIGLVLVSASMIAYNIRGFFPNMGETVRAAFFQVASIITTTGYTTVNFDMWNGFSKAILLLLMFIGGCAGSTAGGLKVSRIVMLFKGMRRELQVLMHPRSVKSLKFEGKKLDDEKLSATGTYFSLYMLIFAVLFLIISLEPFDFATNFSAVATCFNNVGPGLSKIGPMFSFAEYSPWAKVVLSFAMLLGRLEIYPLLLMILPSTWRKK